MTEVLAHEVTGADQARAAGWGPSVLLVHAGIADRRMWDDQVGHSPTPAGPSSGPTCPGSARPRHRSGRSPTFAGIRASRLANSTKMTAGNRGRRRIAARKAAANNATPMIATLTRKAKGVGPSRWKPSAVSRKLSRPEASWKSTCATCPE